MSSEVFYSSLENKRLQSPLNKLKRLFNKCSKNLDFESKQLTAIKTHFGEYGNTAFIKPVYLRPIIDQVMKLQLKPFLVDTNTLYVGMRTNTVDHLHNAALNGFNYSTFQIPVVIADGLRGENTVDVKIENGEILDIAKVASDIYHADAMVVVSHFKGHELSGIGGAIKNLSMGCASRQGKLIMHSTSKPVVNTDKCTSCGLCAENCAADAILLEPKARITDKCTGCTRCVAVCPESTIEIDWNESSENTQKKMAEYAKAVHSLFPNRIFFINIITDVAPTCDCFPANDQSVCPDIGFLSSTDPVAADKASYDLVAKNSKGGQDPFSRIYTEIDPLIQLKHAEKISLGSLNYDLKTVK